MKKEVIVTERDGGLIEIEIDLSVDSEFSRIYFELEKKFNKEVYRLQQEAEEKAREADARYGYGNRPIYCIV